MFDPPVSHHHSLACDSDQPATDTLTLFHRVFTARRLAKGVAESMAFLCIYNPASGYLVLGSYYVRTVTSLEFSGWSTAHTVVEGAGEVSAYPFVRLGV